MSFTPTSFSSPILSRLVFLIDDLLRRKHGVFEYTNNSAAIFRMQVRSFEQAVVLKDGTSAQPGDRIIDLHLWNEQLPVMTAGSVQWARRMCRGIDVSLRELARFLGSRHDLDAITLVRANMGFGTRQQAEQLSRISGSFGFETLPGIAPTSLPQRLHLLGENILISLMVAARNKAALRPDSLKRDRVQVFLSRRRLVERYGCSALEPAYRGTDH